MTDRLDELADRDRLRQVGLAAALADALLVALHGEGGDGDHRDGLELRIVLQPFGDFEAGDFRKLDVHQHQVGVVLAGEIERLDAVAGADRVVAVRLQQVVEELHVELVVLHDQNRLGHSSPLSPADNSRVRSDPRSGRASGTMFNRLMRKGYGNANAHAQLRFERLPQALTRPRPRMAGTELQRQTGRLPGYPQPFDALHSAEPDPTPPGAVASLLSCVPLGIRILGDEARPFRRSKRQRAARGGRGVAIGALAFLASDREQLGRFLAVTGIGPDAIRDAARDPGFLSGVLDHVAGDETLLVAFADQAGIDPAEIERARAALGGAWERDMP